MRSPIASQPKRTAAEPATTGWSRSDGRGNQVRACVRSRHDHRERVKEDTKTSRARVDHAGPREHVELGRGAREFQARAVRGRPGHGGETAAARHGGGGARRGHRQHGALDRFADSRTRQASGVHECLLYRGAVAGRGWRADVRQAAQELAYDHTRVPLRTEQNAVGKGLPDLMRARGRWQLVKRTDRGEHRQMEIGAGICVGDREDVERVELLAHGAERLGGDAAPAPHRRAVEELQCRHDRRIGMIRAAGAASDIL